MLRPTWRNSWPAVMLVMTALGTTPAAAQSHSQPRVEISANVDALTGAATFTESEAFTVNAETETVTVNHAVKTALGFDAGASVKIVGQLWVGAHYAMTGMKPSAAIMALVPHPLMFNAPRTVQGSMSDVAHDERDVHVDVIYALPVRAVDVRLMAGPTFVNLRQDFVSAVRVSETYPFDTATFASAATTQLSRSAVGVNGGVDVSRPLSRRVAVGALVRYSRADVKFAGGNIAHQTVKAGGVEAAGGIRVKF